MKKALAKQHFCAQGFVTHQLNGIDQGCRSAAAVHEALCIENAQAAAQPVVNKDALAITCNRNPGRCKPQSGFMQNCAGVGVDYFESPTAFVYDKNELAVGTVGNCNRVTVVCKLDATRKLLGFATEVDARQYSAGQ